MWHPKVSLDYLVVDLLGFEFFRLLCSLFPAFLTLRAVYW